MSFDDVSAVDFVGTNSAVIRTLRTRESTLGPTERVTVHVQQSVLLLDAEPRTLFSRHVHHLLAFVPKVGGLRLTTE